MKTIKLLCTLVCALFSVEAVMGQTPNLITVETDNQMMVFVARQGGKIAFCYWGEKMSGVESFLATPVEDGSEKSDMVAPQLYPAYGGREYLEPALKLVHGDGVHTTELVFRAVHSEVIDSNTTKTTISLSDKIYPVNVDICFLAYRVENVICQWVEISHNEKKGIAVESIASTYIPLLAEKYYLTHFNGTWSHELQREEECLTHGIKVVESKKGVRTTQSESPMFLLSLDTPMQERAGEVYAGALAWSGNYRLAFEVDECNRLHIIGGMNPFASTINLPVGKRFSSPKMVLSYNSSGVGQLSRNLHDWSRKYSLAHGSVERPVVLNSWEGAYFSFDEKTLTDMMDKGAETGIEMFVLDDGWFGNAFPRNGDNAGLGDWQVNEQKLPRGIGYLADYAVSKGMKFGIWIEPEMVNPDSELAHKHPEWIVCSGEREKTPIRNQWLLDLSNPEVQDFVVKTVDDVMAMSPNISYVKWDANRHVENFGSTYLDGKSQSHFWYEYVQGLYSTYERIRAKYPDVQLQLCSSGSGRLDFGALKYHDEFWTSDNTNALDRVFIQYGASLFYPAMAMAAHISTSPNHQTGQQIPLKFRVDVAMAGRLGMELQPKDLQGEDYEIVKQAIATYKDIRPIVHLGDLYRLISPYDADGWASQMYVTKDKKQAVCFAYSLKYHGRTVHFKSKLDGLDPKCKYRVEEINRGRWWYYHRSGEVFTGDYLMKEGVDLSITNPFDSAVLLITAVD